MALLDALGNVPIIGQPRIGSWFFCVQVVCPCGTTVLLVGQIGSRSQCPSCGKIYTFTGMPSINEQGHVAVPLGMGVVVPKDTPPA